MGWSRCFCSYCVHWLAKIMSCQSSFLTSGPCNSCVLLPQLSL
uniref:Uncharacterized protein n=1 Tax=Anguilla anguilla TaxID=7936 RepID=A0A0E9SCI2_ANGAN